VQSVTPEEAAALAAVSTRIIYRWVEAGQLHFNETAEQSPLICLNSLLRSTDTRRK
jgi:predicted site-specific integrase-resolvase